MRSKIESPLSMHTLIRSRRKTLAIHIKPNGAVEIRAPQRLAKAEIDRFVESKLQWIEQKQAQLAARKSTEPQELPPTQYVPGEFEQTARELIATWEQRLGVKTSFVGFRAMTSRWGSCTAKTRRVRLNSMLEYCPRECLEYVVIHELAHLRENNHSNLFWTIVAQMLPDYKARQVELRAQSWLLRAFQEQTE